MALNKIQQIQYLLGVQADGIWGAKSQAALDALIGAKNSGTGPERTDWRGYVPVDVCKLTAALPAQAQKLVTSFLEHAEQWNLNPLFLVAISKHETANWTSNVFKTKANAMGISNAKSAVAVPSHDESIRVAAKSLGRAGGLYSACKTLADVAKVYAPPGAANDPTKVNSYWPKSVARYWQELEEAVK